MNLPMSEAIFLARLGSLMFSRAVLAAATSQRSNDVTWSMPFAVTLPIFEKRLAPEVANVTGVLRSARC